MVEGRQIFQQTSIANLSQETNEWQRLMFKSDDDLSLPISICLSSSDGRDAIVASVVQAAGAYGFTKIIGAAQAPGSFFFRMEIRFQSSDRRLARSQKRKLQEALLKEQAAQGTTSKERNAIKKVKKSLLERIKKGISAVTIGGVLLFAGNMAADAAKDAVKDVLKDAIKPAITKSLEKVDTFIAKELPPKEAHHFHQAVKNFIESSSEKSTVDLPRSSRP